MTDASFSDIGDPATEFEQQLLAVADQGDIWVLIGQRIGAHALFIVLDEIGGEKVSVPRRDSFQQRLFRPLRDAQIRAMNEQLRLTQSEIAERTGLSRQTVGVILSHPGDEA